MSNIDQDFVEYVIKSIVGNPEAVSIERKIDEKGVLLTLTVDPEDLGRVIGKRGATAQSVRTLLRALGTKNDARYNLKIADNGDGPRPSNDNNSASTPGGAWGADDTVATDDSVKTDDKPVEEPEEEAVPVVATEEPAEESVADKARKELADLDDLDI